MMPTMIRQTKFSAGEVDPVNFKRTDLSLYLQAAQSLLNCTVSTTALVQKRNGSQKLANITPYCSSNSRAFPFIDKDGNYYLVLFSSGEANVFDSDMNFLQNLPYPAVDNTVLASMDYANVNDSLVFVQANTEPFRISITYGTPNVFAIGPISIYPFPAYDFGTIDYNNFTVSYGVAGNTLTFSFTGLSSDPGFTSEWVGGQIVGEGPDADSPIAYAIITAVAPYAAGTVTFTATVQQPFSGSGPTQGSQYSIRQPAFSATLGYPSVVGYYQNRLFFAATATLPLAIFGSKINEPTDFDVGTGLDTDALVYTLGDSASGPILAINAGKQLEIYTENYEYVAPQDQDSALTPSTFSIREQSAYGSAGRCKPVSYNNDSYYISRSGTSIMQFQFQGIGLAYASTNVSMQSVHLVKNPTNRALVRGSDASQDNFIYYLNPDDTITAFQFSPDFALAALTPIEFDQDVEIVDIVTLNNQLYIIKFYSLTSEYIAEQFVDTLNDGTPLRIDGAVTANVPSNGVVTGLDDFDGYTVNVFLNNQDFGTYEVAGGTITVDNEGETGTAYIGLLYDVEITPMYIFAGAMQTDYFKQITKIFVDYYQSLDFYVNNRLVVYQSFADVQAGLPLSPRSDTAILPVVSGWNRSYTFSITQTSPFDLVITSIGYQVSAAII